MAVSPTRVKAWLPAGRIVQGSPNNRQDKDYKGNVKDKPSWYLAVAVPKTHPEVGGLLNQIFQVAATCYQQNTAVMQQINMGMSAPNFAWKIEDGDDPKNVAKPGFPGNWIFKLSTTLGVIQCCDVNNQPIDPATVKCGYYVDATISFDVNGMQDNTAGMYLNPDCIRLLGYGQEISSGPTPAQLFQGRPAQIPAGASPTPVSPGGAPGGAPMQQQPQQFGAGMPQPQQFGGAPGFTAGQPPMTGGANVQGVQAGGMVQGAPSAGVPGFQATAYPGNPPARG